MALSRTPAIWSTIGLLCLLPIAAAAVRRWGLHRCHQWICRHAPSPALSATQARRVAAPVTQWVMTVNRRYAVFAAPCLAESLVLVWLLRRRGIGATVALGIRTLFGPLESHAWASLDGHPLNDRPEVVRIYDQLDWERGGADGGPP